MILLYTGRTQRKKEDRMFELGDYIVYRGHGVGQVLNIEEKELAGAKTLFFTIKIIANGLKMMIPYGTSDIRSLVTNNDVEDIFNLLGDHDIKIKKHNWNQRSRQYQAKINSGDLADVADVLRTLLIMKLTKKLSFSERKMIDLCRHLIAEEISLCTGYTEQDINNRIDSIFHA